MLSDTIVPIEDYSNAVVGCWLAAGSTLRLVGTCLARRSMPRYARDNERFYAAGDVAKTHPSVATVDKFDNVKFYQVVRIDPAKGKVAEPDGSPLLLERNVGSGRVFPDPCFDIRQYQNRWLAPSLVPFIEQSACISAAGNRPRPDIR